MSKNFSISFTRLIAVLLIIGCHLLQHVFVSNWAWVFNVGVQIFLVVSGYLYGGVLSTTQLHEIQSFL